ncbi:MAG: insulinase family protein [Clostridia bacterium]|nr:insulinase family protein [Clostridia bacterium]
MITNDIKLYENTALREKYYKYSHPCGLDIYVFPKKLSSSYAILAAHYGSIDNVLQKAGNTVTVPDGIAHFLEHKLFANEDGTDAFEHFSAIGADANAYTSFNKTAYLFNCTDNFDDSLKILIDFVTHPYFTKESVERERGIIAQEIKMYDDSPAEACYYGMLEGLYEKHAIRRNICGSVESIEEITPELLYECYRVFYNLSNMALIVCGDLSPERIIAIADEMLPREKSEAHAVRVRETALESPAAFMPRVSKKMKVSKPIFNIGIKDVDIPEDPLQRQRKDAAMSILNEMLFSRAGTLYNELFESGLISPEASYCYTINESFAFNSLAGESDSPEEVLAKTCEYLHSITADDLSEEDFERGKRVMYAEFVKEFDSTDSIANNMLSFIFDGADILGYSDIISDVTLDDVKQLFKDSFKDEYFTLCAVYPLDGQEQ